MRLTLGAVTINESKRGSVEAQEQLKKTRRWHLRLTRVKHENMERQTTESLSAHKEAARFGDLIRSREYKKGNH